MHSKWIYGVRNMLATKPATKPEDLKGLIQAGGPAVDFRALLVT